MKAYRIRNWDKVYEIAQSRRIKKMSWVSMPTELGGSGYHYIRRHGRATDLFTAWTLILRVAARMKTRGLLVSDSGRPLTASDLADETRFPVELFEFALTELCKPTLNWLEKVEDWDAMSVL